MKLHKPQTPHGKLFERVESVWASHPDCQLPVGDTESITKVMSGERVLTMISRGPLMIYKYSYPAVTQWIMDAYGTTDAP
jgi:hypothetical protein